MNDRTLARGRLGLALVGTLIGASAAAQTATAPPPAALVFEDTVVVTAERGEAKQSWIPAATVVFDAAALRPLPSLTLGESLSFVSGFRVQQGSLTSGRPVVSARGFFGGGEAEYVALLIDGVRVADAESGLVDWSTISSSSLTRIDAARGPGASLYGDAAVGGVIQVLTDSSTNDDVITASVGSLDTVSLDGTWRWKRDSVGGFISGATRRSSGFSEHSHTAELTFGSAVNAVRRGMSWRWTANAVGRDQDDPGVLTEAQRDGGVTFDPLFGFDHRNRRTLLTAVSLQGVAAGWTHHARASVNGRAEDGRRTILLAPGLGDTKRRDLSTSAVGGTYEVAHPLGGRPNSTLRLGVDLERQRLDTAYFNATNGAAAGSALSHADGSRIRAGAFASSSWMPVAQLRLFGALRWDRIADSDFGRADVEPMEAWSPRIGVSVQAAWMGGASAYGQYSRAFKTPTLDQMFDPRPYPDFRGGSFTISNALLTAQRASNVEGGVSGGGTVRWSVVGYRMDVENEIDFDARTFSYANIGQSRHVGFEAETHGRIGARVRPLASYTLSKVAADAAAGLQLKNVPRHQLTVGGSVSLAWKVEAFAALRCTWGAFLDDDNHVEVETGPLVDVRIRRAVRRAEVFVDLQNAFDQQYDEFGFVLADFRGGRVPYVYPGQPRVLRMGVTLGVR